jgi:hypothetical protein
MKIMAQEIQILVGITLKKNALNLAVSDLKTTSARLSIPQNNA